MSLAVRMFLIIVVLLCAASIVFLLLFYKRPLATIRWLRRSALFRAGFRRVKIRTAVGVQTVLHAGSGPLLVLLHGAGDEAGTWYKTAPNLKHNYELVIPDLAGHRGSEPRSGILSIGTLLTALEQVLDTNLWASRPLILVGNSLGAWMAMLYAHKHPDRVLHVVLIGGGPIRHLFEIGIQPKTRDEARRAFDAVVDPSYPKRPNFILDDLVRISNLGPIARLLAAGESDIAKYFLEHQLGDLHMPVDLIWGESDRLVSLDYAQRLQSQLAETTLTVIPRCGHAPQLECPGRFTLELTRVLAARERQPNWVRKETRDYW